MNTIKSSSDITYLFENGRRIGTPDFSFIIARTAEQHDQNGRVAFIAGKKLGNAVWRNRAKRRMREVCKIIGGPFPGYDVVFLAKRRVNESSFSEMVIHAEKALKKNSIIELE